jgi:hypothetical protein
MVADSHVSGAFSSAIALGCLALVARVCGHGVGPLLGFTARRSSSVQSTSARNRCRAASVQSEAHSGRGSAGYQPRGDHSAILQNLIFALCRRNYNKASIRKLARGHWVCVLRTTWRREDNDTRRRGLCVRERSSE